MKLATEKAEPGYRRGEYDEPSLKSSVDDRYAVKGCGGSFSYQFPNQKKCSGQAELARQK
jgi:hypothetical protein